MPTKLCVSATTFKDTVGGTAAGKSAWKNIQRIAITEDSTSRFTNAVFDGCDNLRQLTIPPNMVSMSAATLKSCPVLESIELPYLPIGTSASTKFYFGNLFEFKSTALTAAEEEHYELAKDENYMNMAFKVPKTLERVKINKGNTIFTFTGMKMIKEVVLPDDLQEIPEEAFINCSGLEGIDIPHGTQTIGQNAFANCVGLTSVTIPDTVTSIESGAFASCKNLVRIVIPSSVTSIGEYAFDECENLTLV